MLKPHSKLAILPFLIIINFLIRFLVQYFNLFYLKNPTPTAFLFGNYLAISLLILITFCFFYFRIFAKFPIISVLILSGLYSNFIEKTLFGFVIDYLNFGISYLNLADVQIFCGIIFFNLKILIFSKKLY
jgi:lipoprotein signal peptidase